MIGRVPRVLTILGSGETSPTMVTPHQRTFARLGPDVRAVLLDSPYGFQENADELTEKAQQYFRASVGREVGVLYEKAGRMAGQMVGKSDHLHAVYVTDPTAKTGDLVRVRITESGPNSLGGTRI